MAQNITISEGHTFFVTNLRGNAYKTHEGLFFNDTRHLSTYDMFINGALPDILTSQETSFNTATFALTNLQTNSLPERALSIFRNFRVKSGFKEELRITNNTRTALTFIISFILNVDFADIFEIKGILFESEKDYKVQRQIIRNVNPVEKKITYQYDRQAYLRYTRFNFTQEFYEQDNKINFSVSLNPHETWELDIVGELGEKTKKTETFNSQDKPSLPSLSEMEWSFPHLITDWDHLKHSYTQSMYDLAALRTHGKEIAGTKTSLPAAGLPWFMTIFGRDSLITSYQTLLFGTDLAIGALKTLAEYQGREINPLKEEEPGKILHEIRFGEIAHFADWVQFPYYGSVDATPLFIILTAEVAQFCKNNDLLHELKPHLLAANAWIDKYGDKDKDGYVEYHRSHERGLLNQNWRDSFDSMLFKNGEAAETPIASADVQGYVYDAKKRLAKIARDAWGDVELAKELENQAQTLKKKFNKEFWVEQGEYFALGLDKDKNQIDSLASSIGHLLWSGIVEKDKIKKTIEALLSEDLYSGWGVRTLAASTDGYHPLVYHRGTVWPHDNSLIAAGLYRLGHRDEATIIMANMLDAASYFFYRLPEVFAGYAKTKTPFPVQYPTSSSPQAWAAGTPILFLRLLLGLEPDQDNQKLTLNPYIPQGVEKLTLDGVAAFGKYFRIEIKGVEATIEEVETYVCHICRERVTPGHGHN